MVNNNGNAGFPIHIVYYIAFGMGCLNINSISIIIWEKLEGLVKAQHSGCYAQGGYQYDDTRHRCMAILRIVSP